MHHKSLNFILLALVLGLNVSAQSGNNKQKEFSFVAFGDMPYFLPQDEARFDAMIHFLNKGDHIFEVFVGDIKSSSTTCADTALVKVKDMFSTSTKPLVYTPGDNEWTDCIKPEAGSFMAEERLAAIRKIFYQHDNYTQNVKLNLIQQSTFPGYETFVENAFWTYGDVAFATLHIVGSNNHLIIQNGDTIAEFLERQSADTFWMHRAFENAKQNDNKGLVLFFHADMFTADKGMDGFKLLLDELRTCCLSYGKPVLLIHGDSHKFLVDKPFMDADGRHTLLNCTRVQVFGEYDMHAVRISIKPETAAVFSIEEFWIPYAKPIKTK